MPMITDSLKLELYAYIGGIVKGENADLLAVGGMNDHVHLLIRLRPIHQIPVVVRRIKGNSSRWINQKCIDQEHFSWQRGYGIFSVSESNVEIIKNYILNQEKHHQHHSFRREYLALLKKHRVDYDERYLWTD